MTANIRLGKAGRLVVPKAVRERLRNLGEGAVVKLECDDTLSHDDDNDPPVKIKRLPNGLRVIEGWEGFDAVKAVKEARQQAEDRLLGKLSME